MLTTQMENMQEYTGVHGPSSKFSFIGKTIKEPQAAVICSFNAISQSKGRNVEKYKLLEVHRLNMVYNQQYLSGPKG